MQRRVGAFASPTHLAVADRVYVLNRGRLVLTGDAAELRDRADEGARLVHGVCLTASGYGRPMTDLVLFETPIPKVARIVLNRPERATPRTRACSTS